MARAPASISSFKFKSSIPSIAFKRNISVYCCNPICTSQFPTSSLVHWRSNFTGWNYSVNKINDLQSSNLTLFAPIPNKEKKLINWNVYFHISLRCLKRFYKALNFYFNINFLECMVREGLIHFMHCSFLIPPENMKKPLVLW